MNIVSRLIGLECPACGEKCSADEHGHCPACRGPLACTYDLAGLTAGSFPAAEPGRAVGVFRWSALLPARDPAGRLSLGEGDTPLTLLPGLAAELDLGTLWAKQEGFNPLGSFKARGLAVALAAHVERGATAITLPSAGNAASAAAAYARRHGIPCRVVLPSAASATYRAECRLLGARVIGVSGDLGVAGDWAREHPGPPTDHLVATFREPFRVEGKKTMGFELWEALGEDLPDALVYPTGGGTGLVALAKAFDELRAAGLLKREPPRLVAVQTDGCAPVVRALEAGADDVAPWEGSRRTLAEGLRVPKLAGGRLVLDALRRTGGTAVAVSEAEILDAIRAAARHDGLVLSPEGGAALAGLRSLRSRGELGGSRVALFETAHPYKSAEALAAAAAG